MLTALALALVILGPQPQAAALKARELHKPS
jgi:hypothetical protein